MVAMSLKLHSRFATTVNGILFDAHQGVALSSYIMLDLYSASCSVFSGSMLFAGATRHSGALAASACCS